MSRSAVRRPVARAVAVVATTALLGGGLAFVAPQTAGTATAAGCDSANRATKDAGLGITHNYSKSVAMTAGAGAKVTYKIDVGTSNGGNPYVNTIVDTPPAGFGKPTAKVRAYHFLEGLKEEVVAVEAAGKGWKVGSGGWSVTSGNPVTASFTYDLPLASVPGVPVTSGGIEVVGTVGVSNKLPDLTACYLTRIMTPGEAIGSVGDDLSSSGSTQDIISDVVEGIVSGALAGAGSSR
ncbi:hypothetical protein [Gordonia sp. (in: high G+C Gram-positive bacteria)]|uniref:hypothetical protein n=1 Tax=Gordonia sp. (in: high G+C Gram-positive bacteria) TaxID=84139 RepID=UPI003C77FB4F